MKAGNKMYLAGRAYLDEDYDLAIGILNDMAYNDINPKYIRLDHYSRLYGLVSNMFFYILVDTLSDGPGKQRAFIKRLMAGEDA